MTLPVESVPAGDIAAVEALQGDIIQLRTEMGRVIVGMDEAFEQLVITLLCRGHCILEGVPGLAKTMMISTMSSMIGLSFKRIQFTPDLMPADITGSDVLEEDHTTGKRIFRFVRGPVFANIILADEINRTPPKTQSALLEAMQERQVTIGETTHSLPEPFFVLATQNPIEQEGTYPLPEAQLDRFLMKIRVGYPSGQHEIEIAKRATTDYQVDVSHVLSADQVSHMQSLVRRIPTGEHVYEYASALARETRPPSTRGEAPGSGSNHHYISWGAGPRGSICLLMAAKARALLQGRFHVTTEDVRMIALPTLRHRIVPTFHAQVEGKSSDDIIRDIIDRVRIPDAN